MAKFPQTALIVQTAHLDQMAQTAQIDKYRYLNRCYHLPEIDFLL